MDKELLEVKEYNKFSTRELQDWEDEYYNSPEYFEALEEYLHSQEDIDY